MYLYFRRSQLKLFYGENTSCLVQFSRHCNLYGAKALHCSETREGGVTLFKVNALVRLCPNRLLKFGVKNIEFLKLWGPLGCSTRA